MTFLCRRLCKTHFMNLALCVQYLCILLCVSYRTWFIVVLNKLHYVSNSFFIYYQIVINTMRHISILFYFCQFLYLYTITVGTRYTVEPRYNEVLGTMKITLLYQVSHYIRVKKQRNIKSWDQQNDLVIRGFCYIRPLYNEVPLYM